MAIKIIEPKIVRGKIPPEVECIILADAEDDITSLGEIVSDGRKTVKPAPGSFAYTADTAVKYHLAPSTGWVKMGG